MEPIEVFLQGEGLGEVRMITVPAEAQVKDLLEEAYKLGVPRGEVVLLVEDDETDHAPETSLKDAGIEHHHGVHCHRCRKVEVTVNYQQHVFRHPFPPSATIERVKRWIDERLEESTGMTSLDAAEHALTLCGGETRPAPGEHLGVLVHYPECAVCFDFKPKPRVQG